jgi:hypothetical protein
VRPASHVAWQVIDGEGVLMDLRAGNALGLNAVGVFVWSRLATLTPDEIVLGVAQEFRVERETAQRDVEAFLADLQARGLLAES